MVANSTQTLRNGWKRTLRKCNHCGFLTKTLQVEVDDSFEQVRKSHALGQAVRAHLVVFNQRGEMEEIPLRPPGALSGVDSLEP